SLLIYALSLFGAWTLRERGSAGLVEAARPTVIGSLVGLASLMAALLLLFRTDLRARTLPRAAPYAVYFRIPVIAAFCTVALYLRLFEFLRRAKRVALARHALALSIAVPLSILCIFWSKTAAWLPFAMQTADDGINYSPMIGTGYPYALRWVYYTIVTRGHT